MGMKPPKEPLLPVNSMKLGYDEITKTTHLMVYLEDELLLSIHTFIHSFIHSFTYKPKILKSYNQQILP
jgi:hypothetical protein